MKQQPLWNGIPPERIEAAKDAAEHADRVHTEWQEQALYYVKQFAIANSGSEFQCADIRIAAANSGLPPSPDERAWGAIVIKAVSLGLIIKTGKMKTDAYGSYKQVYSSGL